MPSAARPMLLAVVLASPLVFAQEGSPGPAPEVQKLAPLLGNWAGSGLMSEPGGKQTKWQARGSYRWCLDGHWVQEDFEISFEDNPAPLVFRGYMGWDREQKRYVNLAVNNAGEVRLNEMKLLPDGTLLQMMMQNQQGTPYAERSLLKVDGDTMVHSIDLLMADGPSIQMIDGKFTKADKAFEGAFDGGTWMGAAPAAAVQKLARSGGTYEVQGQILMGPGAPPVKIHGVDTFRSVFGGTVLHGHTDGAAEGVPGKYVGEVFWGFDAIRGCLVGAYVSNVGEVMAMDARWSEDGKLVSTSASTRNGQPVVQRMLMEFDDKGVATGARSDTIFGTLPPFESFRATYTKK